MTVLQFKQTDEMKYRRFLNTLVEMVDSLSTETSQEEMTEQKEVEVQEEDLTRLETGEAAKRFRQDIKAAQKAGKLPKDMKVSVRVDRFAGGSAIDVSIKKLGFNPVNPEFNPKAYGNNVSRYTDEGKQLLVTLEEMLNKYNYNNSDITTDYYDVNFYQHIGYDL